MGRKSPTPAQELRELIDSHGIPISHLAGVLGVTKQTLHNQLSGRAPVSKAILLALNYVPTAALKESCEL